MSIPKTVPFFGTDDDTIGDPDLGIPWSQPSIRCWVLAEEIARTGHVKVQRKRTESSGDRGKKNPGSCSNRQNPGGKRVDSKYGQ